MRALVRVVSLALVVVTAIARAQTPSAGRPLSLDAATARALARNHAIAIEYESVRISAAGVERASGAYEPSFHLDGRYRKHTDPVNSLFSGAPAGKDAPDQSGVFGSASFGALLPTGASVSLSSAVAR